MICRACGKPLDEVLVDLGNQPLANSYLVSPSDPDPRYPLIARLCTHCLLVQTDPAVTPADIFTNYAFASGNSAPWLQHCRDYVLNVLLKRYVQDGDQVIEIASNDGTLLSCFPDTIRVLGVDPAANIVAHLEVETVVDFFTLELADHLPRANLLIANNVLGHVPDINNFVAALHRVLAPTGVCTIETPHLLRLLTDCQFDTIYHEHYNYWSLHALEAVLGNHGLHVFDVERLGVHGGSLRLHIDRGVRPTQEGVKHVRAQEHEAKLDSPASTFYTRFQHRVDASLHRIRNFFDNASSNHKHVAGIGAPAKGNTLLNAAHIEDKQLIFTTDTSPTKQRTYLPGSHVYVGDPGMTSRWQPDYNLILAWNWADAIMASHAYIRTWGGKFVIPIPRMETQ